MAQHTGPTAAIAGITPGVQGQGVWTGRRQLFVRFAGEAETAVLYTPEMLGKQVERAAANTALHSIALAGRDPLSSTDLIAAGFQAYKPTLPVMLDCDGQRPDAVARDHGRAVDAPGDLRVRRRARRSPSARSPRSRSAVAAKKEHALVLAPRDATSDGQILRLVETAHAVSPERAPSCCTRRPPARRGRSTGATPR